MSLKFLIEYVYYPYLNTVAVLSLSLIHIYLKVVATGGLGRAIADETDSIDIYDSSLTLDGLRIIYDKNRK